MHPASSYSLSPLELHAENHGGPHKALSEPSSVFKGSDKIQEIDGIAELFVLKGNAPNTGTSENKCAEGDLEVC